MESLQKLEYDKIQEKLASYCHMELSKQKAFSLQPSGKVEEVRNWIAQTTEAVNLLYRCGLPPQIEFADDQYAIQRLEANGVLSLKSILNFTRIFTICRELREYFEKEYIDPVEYPILQPMFSALYTNIGLIERIQKSILDENTVDDNASKTLASIRKKHKNIEQEIKQKLTNMVHSANYAKYVQESLVTIRNERYVIPVKEEYRTQIKGFVHDVSSSGSTVFIEPITVFELNNQMANLKIEETIEIEHIIQELSKLFYPYVEEIKRNIKMLTQLDFIFAKALYAREIDANEPQINTKKVIKLEEARHPLIDKNKVVPITITLGETYKTLVMTGPNTGGKTVTLKTVGLLTCMACSGLHIPAKKTSSIYVFQQIFADIGDEQSIADSLSTFSAHMKNIVNITEKANETSLVLLDELGSGTDPVEGQALAISILEYLHDKGILTIATTHYQELKKYALMAKEFENASVEFEVETLTPTYRLIIGVPGKSNAFDISKKIGLNETIIQKSQSRMDQNDVDFETVIKQIYEDKKQIEQQKAEMEKNLEEVKQLKKTMQGTKEEALKQEKETIENAKLEAKMILRKAQEEANQIIKELNQLRESDSQEKEKTANQLRKNLGQIVKDIVQEETIEEKPAEMIEIEPNTPVFVKSLQQEGVTASHISKDGEVLVQIGSMKLQVPVQNLEMIAPNRHKQNVNIRTQATKTRNVTTEINVIGMTVEEARMVVDKFLDDSHLAKLQTVHIIHGKGTGKLRKGIQEFLQKHPHVKSYRLGTFGEGEMGVTVVELK